jgi:hypothetical protein
VSQHAEDFRETAHVRRFTRVDFRGQEEHGAPQEVRCRFQEGTRVVRSADGRTLTASATMFTAAQVTPRDLVFAPGADPLQVGNSRRPLQVYERKELETGRVDHYEVIL